MEFDKSVVGSVVDREAAMAHDQHPSLAESDLAKKPTLSLDDCLALFTKCETLSKDDTWYARVGIIGLMIIVGLITQACLGKLPHSSLYKVVETSTALRPACLCITHWLGLNTCFTGC